MAEIVLQTLWAGFSFFLGALPFSVWIGRLAAGRDIREVGDKNPGATNVLRSAGFAWFMVAMFLDITKAALPVGLAYHIFDWRNWGMFVIAMAPVLGHAFSPFLGRHGGKAVATAFGAWIGLSIWPVPLVALLSLTVWFALINVSGWAVILAELTIMAYLIAFDPNPLFIAVSAGQLALLAYTHRADLQRRPSLRFLARRNKTRA